MLFALIFSASAVSSAVALTIFEEDFESGDISNWITYQSGFKVVDFQGNKVLSSGGGSHTAFIEGDDWTDYTVEGDLYLYNGSYWAYAFGLAFRATHNGSLGSVNSYNFQLRPYAFQIEQWDTGRWTYLASKSSSFSKPNTWYHFKVVCEGANIKAYIDDVLIFDVTDTSNIHLNGGVGMRLWNAGAYLDNVKVTVPGIDICEELAAITDQINGLPDSAFKNNNGKLKKAFENKLAEVCTSVQYAQDATDEDIKAQFIKDALKKLNKDILAKMDGSAGGSSKNDWIVDEETQSQLYQRIMLVVGAIEEL